MTTATKLSFVHRFEPATDRAPPLASAARHRRRRDDLIDLGRMVAPGAALLSPRGKVLEGGSRALLPRARRRRVRRGRRAAPRP